jgi:hypothetical protein
MHDQVMAVCEERFGRLRDDVDSVLVALNGNGSPGLKREVALNSAFRVSMEDFLSSINKKVWGFLLIQLLSQAVVLGVLFKLLEAQK